MTTYIPTLLKTIAKPKGDSVRVARIVYKQTKEQKAQGIEAQDSLGVVIPMLTRNAFDVVAATEEGQAYFFASLKEIQNACIREAYESGATITDETFSPKAMIEWLASNVEESVRLSEKSVSQWFDGTAAPIIAASLVAQRGMEEGLAWNVTRNYKKEFMLALVKDATFASESVASKVKAMAELISEHSDAAITAKIVARIQKMDVYQDNQL
jgi:hypothetical protein